MFRDLLPPGVREQIAAADAARLERTAVFANLSDSDLVASARFWLAHCVTPKKYPPGELVYDSTFWHVIIPELLRRIDHAD